MASLCLTNPTGFDMITDAVELIHKPVMLREVLEALQLKPGMRVLDCTVGAGGHAREILNRIQPEGELIGIDRDPEVLDIARDQLKDFPNRLIQGNFRDLTRLVQEIGCQKVDAALFDLGVSSYQLESGERGFSFQREARLDMRMDPNAPLSAFDLVNHLSEWELVELLNRFGQERYARRISRAIVHERQRSPIATTKQLADLICRAVPRHRWTRIHPATRTFQALRIEVNRELEALESAIPQAVQLLASGGRLCIISFHSLEDRVVKVSFRKLSALSELRIITKKPLEPSLSEIKENPRSRSAKLRIGEKG